MFAENSDFTIVHGEQIFHNRLGNVKIVKE